MHLDREAKGDAGQQRQEEVTGIGCRDGGWLRLSRQEQIWRGIAPMPFSRACK